MSTSHSICFKFNENIDYEYLNNNLNIDTVILKELGHSPLKNKKENQILILEELK